MAAEPKYDMTVHPTAGLVRSASRGNVAHQVTLTSCDCEDYINRKGQLVSVDGVMAITVCKHIAQFMERVGGWNRDPEPKTVVHSDLTRQRAGHLLAGYGLNFNAVLSVLDGIAVPHGVETLPLASGGAARITYHANRRYDVELPA